MSLMAWWGLALGLGCAGTALALGLAVAALASRGTRTEWEAEAHAVLRRAEAANRRLRSAVAASPKGIKRSLRPVLKQADELVRRVRDYRDAGVRAIRGLEGIDVARLERELLQWQHRERTEADPALRAQHGKTRESLEHQVAHVNALRSKLSQLIGRMRDMQATLEAMQPRIARLSLHGVDSVELGASSSEGDVLSELDVFIEELSRFDDTLDIEAIKADIEAETKRRLATGELEYDPGMTQGPEVTHRRG